MKAFLYKIKQYYPMILNCIAPFVLFFIPVHTLTLFDEIDSITYSYNFYEMFDFASEPLFASMLIVIMLCIAINLIFFILFLVNSYKISIYKPLLYWVVKVVNIIFVLASIVMFIKAICISADIMRGEFAFYKNGFCAGSVVFLIYALIQAVLTFYIFRRKNGKRTF